MTDKELERLEALCAKASPAPWDGEGRSLRGEDGGLLEAEEDFDFAAAARTALPAALAEIRRLRALMKSHQEDLQQMASDLLERMPYVSESHAKENLYASKFVQRAADLAPVPGD